MTHVRVVGTGLIGASVGLALSRAGFRVSLVDPSPTAVAIARDMGAGEIAGDDHPDVVLVGAPPDVAAEVIAQQLQAHPDAVVTDVASVKEGVLGALTDLVDTADLARYVGSHPMAGRERSGAVAARADLFVGRTWVVCPRSENRAEHVEAVRRVAAATGASVVDLAARDHDEAVAAVSHLPQIAASLVAARLRDLPVDAVALAGQGLRDVTRIAESDPLLWTQILAGNARAVLPVVRAMAEDLSSVADALEDLTTGDGNGARNVLAQAISDGQLGHARIPGKHGGAPTTYATLVVVVPDEPGQLGRLFADVGEAGVNLEDLRLEHGAGAQVGLAELSVLPAAGEHLRDALTTKGWKVHE